MTSDGGDGGVAAGGATPSGTGEGGLAPVKGGADAGSAGTPEEGGAAGSPGCSPRAEICGNRIDDDCNGVVDEGCVCAPVAAGAAGVTHLSGVPARLWADPSRCLLYALDSEQPDEVLVVDTGTKLELPRLQLPGVVSELQLSPDGASLVGFEPATSELWLLDVATHAVLGRAPGTATFAALSGGRIAFWVPGSWDNLYKARLVVTDVAQHRSFEVKISDNGGAQQIASDAEGASVFVGGRQRWDVSGSSLVSMAERTTEDSSVQLKDTELFVSAQHVYVSSWLPGGVIQLGTGELSGSLGSAPGRVLAEDAASTFAVTPEGVFDALTFRSLASWGGSVTTAALANADGELWSYDPAVRNLHYLNVADLFDRVELGARERPAPTAYSLSRLLVDPWRPRVYGLDPQRGTVVSFDRDTLLPISEVVVGSRPSDVALDPLGETLYVGFETATAFARIELATFEFDGLVPWRAVSYEIEALSGQRVAVADRDQYTVPSILDASSGELLSPLNPSGNREKRSEATLSASASGERLFVGESRSQPARYEMDLVAGGVLDPLSSVQASFNPAPERWSLTLPDGSGVFYAGYSWAGSDLGVRRYALPDRPYAVSPDARVVTTASSVFRQSDGKRLGALPISSSIQAISSDSSMLYAWDGTQIVVVPLGAYQ